MKRRVRIRSREIEQIGMPPETKTNNSLIYSQRFINNNDDHTHNHMYVYQLLRTTHKETLHIYMFIYMIRCEEKIVVDC